MDGEGNVFVVNGRTNNIHVFDPKLRYINVIKCGAKLLNVRLLEYDTKTNRLAIIHSGGYISIYPVTPNFSIQEFEVEETESHYREPLGAGSLTHANITSPSLKHSAGVEGLILPEGSTKDHRRPLGLEIDIENRTTWFKTLFTAGCGKVTVQGFRYCQNILSK